MGKALLRLWLLRVVRLERLLVFRLAGSELFLGGRELCLGRGGRGGEGIAPGGELGACHGEPFLSHRGLCAGILELGFVLLDLRASRFERGRSRVELLKGLLKPGARFGERSRKGGQTVK